MKASNLELRLWKSFPFHDSTEPLPEGFVRFFHAKVLPLLTFTGYKQDAKRDLALRIVHALVMARNRIRTVSDPRDKTDPDARKRIQVWDMLRKAGLAIHCRGSESSGMVTRYCATEKLVELRKRWKLEELVPLDLQRNSQRTTPTKHALVYLHTGKIDLATGEPLAAGNRKVGIPLTGDFIETEDVLEAFNANLLNFSWSVKLKDVNGRTITTPVNPCLKQIHSGRRYRAVRFYSWSWLSGQLLNNEERKHILIGGEPVAELDYSGCQLRMLYQFKGLNPAGDIYRPHLIFKKLWPYASEAERTLLREFVKRATLICLNVKSRSAAHSSIGKIIHDHPERTQLKNFLRAERPQTRIKGITQRIIDAHGQEHWNLAGRPKFGIQDYLFIGEGLNLMKTESFIMHRMLKVFTKAKKPALMIHDAVVCRKSDVLFSKRVMEWAWRAHVNMAFFPVIKREF